MQRSEIETTNQITWLGEVLFDLSCISGSIDFLADTAFQSSNNEVSGFANVLEIIKGAMSKAVEDVSSIHHNLSEAA